MVMPLVFDDFGDWALLVIAVAVAEMGPSVAFPKLTDLESSTLMETLCFADALSARREVRSTDQWNAR